MIDYDSNTLREVETPPGNCKIFQEKIRTREGEKIMPTIPIYVSDKQMKEYLIKREEEDNNLKALLAAVDTKPKLFPKVKS